MTIGKNIKKYREKCGMTQVDVCMKTGISPAVVSLFETDTRKPSIEKAKQLAALFGVTLNDLVE